jgi:hypothetical protein
MPGPVHVSASLTTFRSVVYVNASSPGAILNKRSRGHSSAPGSIAERSSNFSGKPVIILPGDRSNCGQHTHTPRRASIARAKRTFIMEM